jgi:DNA (cytosine-5)-methyltransferase 3A
MDIETNGFMGKQGVIEMLPFYATPIEWDENGKPTKAISSANGKTYIVYEVKDGLITIRDKQYPINLPDGFYIIRKLTVSECKRLQTIPDWYEIPVSDSQAYKLIGNGWTIEVIKYLLSHIPNILNEEIEVLSMYDGMSCGQIALKEMGCNVGRYYATEIDEYAIKTTQHNFPNTIQLGDAFQVRDDTWQLRK